jgi:transposase-like protein
MKLHANAALSLNQRRRMVRRVLEQGWSLTKAAEAAEVSERTCSMWVVRYRQEGELGLLDRSSAPQRIPHRTLADRVEVIELLRRLRMTSSEIAGVLGDGALDRRRSSSASGWTDSAGSTRSSRPTVTSVEQRASCCTSTSRSWDGSTELAGGSAGNRSTPTPWPAARSASATSAPDHSDHAPRQSRTLHQDHDRRLERRRDLRLKPRTHRRA